VAVGEMEKVPRRFHRPSALSKRLLRENDIVFEVSGGSKDQPVGRSMLVSQQVLDALDNRAICASFCKLIRIDPDLADPRFVFRVLQLAYVDGTLDRFYVQSTGITNFKWKPFLADYLVDLPSGETQSRVADVLSAFDDLIENNRRRIALLERMAQAIYREWFVHFRYPGHEDDGFVDSPLGLIPAGWSAASLEHVIELRYGKALKASARRGGPVAVVGSSGVVGWHDEALVNGPAVVVGRKGNVGSLIWIEGDSWPIDTTYYVTTDLPLRFIYRMLSEIEFIDSHAAVPGLSRDQAYSIEILRPDIEVAESFEETATELSALSSVLERQTAVLSKVRDALLPKLVTGALDVSNLDLDAPVKPAA
jgi:type I restriction enzyme S subunit